MCVCDICVIFAIETVKEIILRRETVKSQQKNWENLVVDSFREFKF